MFYWSEIVTFHINLSLVACGPDCWDWRGEGEVMYDMFRRLGSLCWLSFCIAFIFVIITAKAVLSVFATLPLLGTNGAYCIYRIYLIACDNYGSTTAELFDCMWT